eukprot:1140231-Pelagomonas_calceolata.AAC.2
MSRLIGTCVYLCQDKDTKFIMLAQSVHPDVAVLMLAWHASVPIKKHEFVSGQFYKKYVMVQRNGLRVTQGPFVQGPAEASKKGPTKKDQSH